MFAIAFDLIVKETAAQHPKWVSAAYAEIGVALLVTAFDGAKGASGHFAWSNGRTSRIE